MFMVFVLQKLLQKQVLAKHQSHLAFWAQWVSAFSVFVSGREVHRLLQSRPTRFACRLLIDTSVAQRRLLRFSPWQE